MLTVFPFAQDFPMLPQADNLTASLRSRCKLRGFPGIVLPEARAAEEQEILEQLIAIREAGRPALSLELIEICHQHTWQSPWLEDNKARALLDLGRTWQAVEIWKQLTACNDNFAVETARTMLTMMCEYFQQSVQTNLQNHGFAPELFEPPNDCHPDQALMTLLELAFAQQDQEEGALTHLVLFQAHALGWLPTSKLDAELPRWEVIEKLWASFSEHPWPDVQAIAHQALQDVQNLSAEASLLEEKLIQCCLTAGWQPQHLGNSDCNASPGLHRALMEIIETRSKGATLVSKTLIDMCNDVGYRSPWLDDNMARLMQAVDRQDAEAIWSQLQNHKNPAVRSAAKHALQQLHQHNQEGRLVEALSKAREKGQATPWRALMLQRIVQMGEGTDTSPSCRREAIHLPPVADEAWDLGSREHKLFQQLLDEHLKAIESSLPASA